MNNKKLISIISGVLIVVVAIGCLIFIPSGNKAVLSSDHFSVDKKSFECFINIQMNEYVTDYTETYGEDYIKNIKLDPNKSLKSQESCYSGSWYDYFKGRATEELRVHLLYCEAAKKQGIKLSSAELNNEIEYLNLNYTGKGDKDSIKELAKVTGLGLKYLADFKSGIKVSDEYREKFIKEHPEEILCVDYGMLEVVEDNDFDMTACEGLAKEIKDSFDNIGFDKTLEAYKTNANVVITDEKSDVKGYRYSNTTQFGDWAFNENRKTGESIIFRGSSQYSVYFIKKTAYNFDYTLREFEFIRVSDKNKDEKSDLIAFYKEYQPDPTEDKYNSLLEKYDFKPDVRVYNAEDIAPDLRKYIYGSDIKIGDFNLVQNGNEVCFIKVIADKGSYFETTLQNNITAVEVSKNQDKLKKEYSIKIG